MNGIVVFKKTKKSATPVGRCGLLIRYVFYFSCYRCAVLLDVNLFELYLHPRQEL